MARTAARVFMWLVVLELFTGACTDSRASMRDRRSTTSASRSARVTVAPVPMAEPGELVEAACGDSTESGSLHCSEGAATRRGDTLSIMLPDGRTVTRVNRPVPGEQELSFQYGGRLGGSSGTPTFHILDIHEHDDNVVELINARTGDSVTIASRPQLSPDGSRFAVGQLSLESCEGATSLEIWRVTSEIPVREYLLEPWDCGLERGWGPSSLEWRSVDTLYFMRNTVPVDSARRQRAEYDTIPARLVHAAGNWTLDLHPH